MLARATVLVLLLTAPAAAQPKPVWEYALPLKKPLSERQIPPAPSWLEFSPDGNYLGVRFPTEAADVHLHWATDTWRERHRWELRPVNLSLTTMPMFATNSSAFGRGASHFYLDAVAGVRLRSVVEQKVGEKTEVVGIETLKYKDVPGGFLVPGSGHPAFVTYLEHEAKVYTWDATSPSEVTLRIHVKPGEGYRELLLSALALDPAATRLAVAWSTYEREGVIELWDVPGQKRSVVLPARTFAPSAVAWSPDGKVLALGYINGRVELWDASTGKETASLGVCSFTVSRLVFGPDGSRLFVTTTGRGDQPSLAVIGVGERKVVVGLTPDKLGIGFLTVSPKGNRVATLGSDSVIRVWDVEALLKAGK